jgi:hypothetical protein
VGCCHGSAKCRSCPRRPRARVCLRKGCGRKYLPRRWNQRYCQDPDCMREVRRWLATKRQARRRLDEKVKAQHAEAQRCRRQRAAAPPQTPQPPQLPELPQVAPERGHAAKIFFQIAAATGQGASNRSPAGTLIRSAFAPQTVGRRCAESSIANASGVCEPLSKVSGLANASTTLPASDATKPNLPTLFRYHHPRWPRERLTPLRRSAVDGLGFQAP